MGSQSIGHNLATEPKAHLRQQPVGPVGPSEEDQSAQDAKRLHRGLTKICVSHTTRPSFLTRVLVGLRWSHILCSRDSIPSEQALGGFWDPRAVSGLPSACVAAKGLVTLLSCWHAPYLHSHSLPLAFPQGTDGEVR